MNNNTYTLVIPTNSLHLLSDWYPDIKVQKIIGEGSGNVQGSREEVILEKGHIRFGKAIQTLNRNVQLEYDFNNGEIPIIEIFNFLKEETGIPEFNIQFLSYMERNLKLGPNSPNSVRCDFERNSIHPGIMKKLVQDGKYPLQEIYQILEIVKNAVKDLPKDVKKRYKPSFLRLEPYPNIKDDGPAIQVLQREPMIFMEETAYNWMLNDLAYKKRGGPRA